ncbi:MAG: LysR family transcriptional regulator, glycine cleavage system transcriptional activator [Pseudonocardiales bacterium]|nr:LysR family transcriptional regulator, glycine cleavage system transcriptional activator [Pseudonocardiales bacterium]
MRQQIPPLPGLHAFEAAARLGSFAAAAAELHLSPAAVSQRIRSLEGYLGVALFERLPRGVRLTDMGLAYLPTVRDLFDELSLATTGLFGSTSRQRLTVRVQISYAATWLIPRLPDFCATVPHIDLRIVCAIWADTLPPDEVDLEIRQGNGSWAGLTSELLHEDNAAVVCGHEHLRRYGPIRDTDDIAARPRAHILGYDDLWHRLFPRPARERSARATARQCDHPGHVHRGDRTRRRRPALRPGARALRPGRGARRTTRAGPPRARPDAPGPLPAA